MSDDYVGVKIDGVLYVKLDDVKPLRKAFDAAQARIERLRAAWERYNAALELAEGTTQQDIVKSWDAIDAALSDKGEKP